jgi:hypothetical protein
VTEPAPHPAIKKVTLSDTKIPTLPVIERRPIMPLGWLSKSIDKAWKTAHQINQVLHIQGSDHQQRWE